jgi:hypothetical protein|tara:strand:- start:1139 stop:1360 length:222 start_codon:yes stop_codon:yes gene_type:complete
MVKLHKEDLPIYVRNYGEGCLQYICHTEKQVDKVKEMLTKNGNLPVDYEEWDEGEDKKYILTFQSIDEPLVKN